jgi:hypothetical protein
MLDRDDPKQRAAQPPAAAEHPRTQMPGARFAAVVFVVLVGTLAAHRISVGVHENARAARILTDSALTRMILGRAISYTNTAGRVPEAGPIARPCHAARPTYPCSAWDTSLPRDPRCADGSAAVFTANTTTYRVVCPDAFAAVRIIRLH